MIKNTLELAAFGPVIPVIVIQRVADAVPLAEALVAGGVRVLEVTLRTPAALPAIEAIARAVPQALVGAGTLRLPGDAQAAKDAGASFAVSPGYTAAMGAACRAAGLPLLPGVATSSEIMAAMADELRFLKFFPATPPARSRTSCSARPAASRPRPRRRSSRCRTSRSAAARG